MERAVYWLRCAAGLENPLAAYQLGEYYMRGLAVRRSLAQGVVFWYG
jgi:TPR repeat protein